MNDEKNWTDTGIALIQNVTRFLWSVASLLAPWLVPFAPAIFLGWSVYETAGKANMPRELAVVAAMAAAVGLETVNIGANHATLHLSHNYEEHIPKFVFSILLVLAYVTAGVVSMAYLGVALSVKVIGIAMFALAPVAIAVQALTMDLVQVAEENEQERALKERELEWQQRQAELEARREDERQARLDGMAYREKLARIDANAKVRIERERVKLARATTEPAREQPEPATVAAEQPQSKFECRQCDRSFGTVQALNAHQRFCAGKANGKQPATEREEQVDEVNNELHT